ncbi:fibronectin type III domain-containing protein [Tenacibaculum sp. M341]|uniref:fibronectin type III domain-containing protein n=1 Tax=Tenacibaculum sp. M341 TaxID=2530339 RepID=UPI001048C0E9|nr:fibronectin type III domain-containing protein [Tenacibaculum sp. M341]TCI84358.1 hypothetical protein EYW44_21840 [Tenacibaculum sp. M341]
MKNIKLFIPILLISAFFLLFGCSDEEVTPTPPPNPSSITITSKNITVSEFTIDWTASTIEGDQGVVYDIYLDDNKVTSDLDALTYTFSDLDAETTYSVKVTSKSNEFETTSTQMIDVTTSIKPTPSNITITSKDITISGFTIDWTASTIEGDQGVVYDIYLDDNQVASDLDALTYSFSNLDAETTYNVKVTSKSNEFGTTSTQMIDVITLAKPNPSDTTITSKDITVSGFTIDWTASTIEGNQGVAYDIYLDDNQVASDLDALTYSFSDLDAETTYNVKVTSKSNEFGTTSTQMIDVTTLNAPKPNDFNISLNSTGTTNASISWSSLTIDGPGGVLADIYINNNEESTGVTSSGWVFTGLTPNTNYTVKIVARSSEFGTTLEKEITFVTEPLPTTFEVTSAEIYPRTTGTFGGPARAIIRFTDRDLLDEIILNGNTYSSYAFAGDDGITFSLSDEEFETLKNATTKEGTANFTENGTSSSKTFTYSVN